MGLRSWFFGEEEEETVEPNRVDPIVEKRRQEKFSKPLIFDEEKVEETPKKEVKEVKKVKKVPQPQQEYQLSQVISPIYGIKQTSTPEKEKPVVRKKSQPIQTEGLVTVISPFYGLNKQDKEEEKIEEIIPEEKPEKKKSIIEKVKELATESEEDVEAIKTQESEPIQNQKEVIDTVENRLRNIASLTTDSKDDLKIIEERTGKFKLDFKKEDSLIDEIDDNMSLDELMNLYEKKFRD